MMREILARGLLYWVRAPNKIEETRHDEYFVAITRVLLSACCLTAIIRTRDHISLKLCVALSLSYFIYSLLVLLALRIPTRTNPLIYVALHCADIVWALHLAMLIRWPAMSLVFFLFVIAGAAMRWGFWETQLTAGALCVLLVPASFIYNVHLSSLWNRNSPWDLFPEILFCIGVSLVIGLLAEARAAASEKAAAVAIMESIRFDCGFERVFQAIWTARLQLFGSTQLLVAVDEHDRNRTFLFRINSSMHTFQSSELDSSQRGIYFFPAPAPSWRFECKRRSGRPQLRCMTLDSGRVKKEVCGVPEAFLSAHPFGLLLAVLLDFQDMAVRVYVIDPIPFFGGAAGLRRLDRMVRQAAPMIHNLYLIDRMKREAEAAAAGRLARELHDGVIQSLSSINLELERLRRQTNPVFQEGVDPLVRLQQSVQLEIAELRSLTQQLHCFAIDSERLLSYLSGLAFKFECESGIHAKFLSEVDRVQLHPRVCAELARIAQEALINVRKHAEATEVLIRLGRRDGAWVLGVIDNGRGFPFSGRLSHEQLQVSGQGPAVIMEHSREINGKVSIESSAGHGSCLEITFPHEFLVAGQPAN